MNYKHLRNFLKEVSEELKQSEKLTENAEEPNDLIEKVARQISNGDKIDTSLPRKNADLINRSNDANRTPANPPDIEKQRWNDPLLPLDQKFVTFKDMNDHYSLFLKRIQQQMSTISGGGEVRFARLDDVDASNVGENRVLTYNSESKKFIFTDNPVLENSLGVFAKTTNATVAAIDTPYPITFDSVISQTGVVQDTTRIVVENDGLYKIDINSQIADNAGGALAGGTMYMWIRFNGTDVPNSTRRQGTLAAAPGFAFSYSFTLNMQANDYVEVYYAADSTDLLFESSAATAFAPSTESVLFSIIKI